MKLIIKIILLTIASFTLSANDKIIIAISSAPNNLNPFFSTDANSQNINRLIHKSLLDFNPQMQYECVACLGYQEKIVKGKQILSFKLRPDLTFFDGSRVTAQDVYNSWQYFAKNKSISSTHMDAFEQLESVIVSDSTTLTFTYKIFSLENIANLGLLKIIKLKDPLKKSIENEDILGCGDYQLENVRPLELTLVPRDKLKSDLVFKVVKDETTLALKLINGEIDLSTNSISPRKYFWLKGKQDVLNVWDLPGANFQFMGLNQKREIFKDIRVRKALSLLLPRQEILKYKLKNTAILSNGMFSPAFVGLYRNLPIDPFDPVQARALLSEAGFKKNDKGILSKNGKPFEIDWKVSNNKASIEIVQVIQHFFEKEGIVVNVSIQEWGTYMSSFKSGKFDIVVGQWVGFTGPDMLNFVFYSSNTPPKGGNRIAYNNPQFDKLIDKATVETDKAQRIKEYQEALDLVISDYAYINLWHPNISWIGGKCLKNVKLDPTGGFYYLKDVVKDHQGRCAKY